MSESGVQWEELEQQLLGFEPMASRLRPPRTQVGQVHRTALVARLLATPAAVIVLSAPAGAGKSITLSQWARKDYRPSAWLQLDSADNDPVALLLYLAAALTRVAPVDPGVLGLLRLRHPPVQDNVLPSLSRSLADAEPFLLILDDAHLIRNEESWRLVEFLLEQLPDGAQLAIGSRAEPRLPIARLRASARLQQLSMRDLAMDRREARELLDLNGCRPGEEAFDRLLAVTEGWPTGLYLAALAGAAADDDRLLSAVRGDRREIAAYLTAEVLERQPADVQTFLLETSILDNLSASLCRAVTGDERAHELLLRLTRENLFVTPLDERDDWFRYHHLFGELLHAQLQLRMPDAVPELHRRAACWCGEHGDDERAVRHWVAAGDVAAAGAPVMNACQMLVDQGQVERARRVLDQFSDEQLSAHTPLIITAGWFYGTVTGEPGRAERWLRAVMAAPADDRQIPGGGGTWHGFQLSLRAFLAPEGIGQMLRDAQEAMELERDVGDLSEPKRVLGVANYLAGHGRRAEQLFREVTSESDSPPIRAYAFAFLALLEADQHRWEEAEDHERQAREQCPEMTLDVSPGMFLALPMLLARVTVLARHGEPALEGERHRAAQHLHDMVPQAPWRLILGSVVLGEVALGQGELADAERWCGKAEGVLKGYPDAGVLAGRVKRLRQKLEELRLTEPLTPAERRVLELLPTQLTAPQIAARLFVSTNTAKTHMRHLYAKLGVTTRTAAVEHATSLGLLACADDA